MLRGVPETYRILLQPPAGMENSVNLLPDESILKIMNRTHALNQNYPDPSNMLMRRLLYLQQNAREPTHWQPTPTQAKCKQAAFP